MLFPISPPLNIFESCRICLNGFCKYSGRGRRSEFWWFFLICVIISSFFIIILSGFIGHDTHYYNYSKHSEYEIKNLTGFFCCLSIFIFAEIIKSIPLLAASTRRLHDVGYSGFYNFLIILPFLNLFLIYLWFLDSDRGPNIYGPSTKYFCGQNNIFMNNNINSINQQIIMPLSYPGIQPNFQIPQQPIANQEQIFMNEIPRQPLINQL